MVAQQRTPQGWAWGKRARTGRAVLYALLLISPGAALLSDDTPPADHWNLFSGSQEARLGLELERWVEARAQPLDDPSTQRLLDAVGKRLAAGERGRISDPEFHIFAALDPYALALPDTDLYVSSGMIAALENEAELAALLAHELAHSALRQLTRKLSRVKRFQIRAVLVAADQDKSTMMEALTAIGSDVVPGAPVWTYTEAEELEAIEMASRLLAGAGYDPAACDQPLRRFRDSPQPVAQRFLQRHPPVPACSAQAGSEQPDIRGTEVSERAFRRLAKAAHELSESNAQLDLLLEWSPPYTEPQPARTRELFISRSYLFSYPSTWRSGKPGYNETIEVAPKGGILDPAGERRRLVVGVQAGTLEPVEGSLTATPTLRRDLGSLRPGLEPLAQAPSGIEPVRDLESAFYSGTSPAGGPELVWLIGARLPETVFYMMLIAPADEFENYRVEFQKIAQSTEFPGFPRSGRAEDPAAGDLKRPETLRGESR